MLAGARSRVDAMSREEVAALIVGIHYRKLIAEGILKP